MKDRLFLRFHTLGPWEPDEKMESIALLGDGLQLGLLLVLLGQLSQAGQGGVHLLDAQEAFGGRGEGCAALKEHPDGLRHVALQKPGEEKRSFAPLPNEEDDGDPDISVNEAFPTCSRSRAISSWLHLKMRLKSFTICLSFRL